MENLKYIEAGLRAAETVRISPRKIWMILEIAAQVSANGDVGIKEMVELRLEADRLFDADGNLKPEPRKTGFDFGAVKDRPNYGNVYYTPLYESARANINNRPSRVMWDNSAVDEEWLLDGIVFHTKEECQSYIDYINSLTDGHS